MINQKLSDSERATKSAAKAVARGCKKIGFFADLETQKKIDEIMKKRQIGQKKELLEMLINEEFQKIA